MKRIFIGVIAIFGAMIANAQVHDHSTVLAKVQLENIISLVPPIDFMGATFNSTMDYADPAGMELKDVWGNHTSPFIVSSNRNFNVTIKAGSANFLYFGTGSGNNIMPCGVLSYNLASNGTGGTNATPSTWNALTTSDAPLINGGTFGSYRPFSLKLKAKPGFDYVEGLYTIDVVLTATQL